MIYLAPFITLLYMFLQNNVGWLVDLILNVPVNIFSVMLGQSHRFLGITSTFLGSQNNVDRSFR